MKISFLIIATFFAVSSVNANVVDSNAALKKAQAFMPDRQFTKS